MKLSKTMRKLIACLCSLAMIVVSMAGYQSEVSAADDYSTLTYTTLTCEGGGGEDIAYSVVNNNITGWNTPWYGDNGVTLQFIFAGGNDNPAANTTIKVNGVETAAGAGAVTLIDAGLVKINPKSLPANAYSTIEITALSGSALIVVKKGTPGEAVETPAPTTTEAKDYSDWTDATDTWTEDGVWNIWTGNGAASKYKGSNTLNDYYVNVVTATGDWSVQNSTVVTGLTAGKMYTYKLTIETDKADSTVGVKDDLSNSTLVYKVFTEGVNTIEGTFTASGTNAKLMLEMGRQSNAGATFHVTGLEVAEYVDDDSEGIPADAKWLGWFEPEGWASYPISDNVAGYTLTDKNIGANWYSVQTGVDNVKFKAGATYQCTFKLTATQPKQFKVDNRSNDAEVFVEATPGQWVDNNDGTYTYSYNGKYTNATEDSQFINIRIALGHFENDENYAANATLTCTLSDFEIVPATDEPVTDESATTEPSETPTPDAPDVIAAPTGLAIAEGVASWVAVENAVAYNVYVNGELKSTGAETTANVAEYITATGVHTIEVSAVTEKGTESEKALVTAKVVNAPEGYTLADENAWTTVGKWQLYNGTWSDVQVARLAFKTTDNDQELDVNYTLVNQNAEWLTQCRYTFEGLQPGTYYTYEIKANDIVIKSDTVAAEGETMTLGDYDISKFEQGTDVKLTATIKEFVPPEPPEFPDGKTLTELIADNSYNIALGKNVSIHPGCAEGSIDNINNGNATNGHCALSSGWGYLGESYAVIDLGDYYDMSTIDMVAVTYKDTSDNDTVVTRSYSVGYSMDGTNYTDVVVNRPIPAATALDILEDKATVDKVATEGTARFIRVYYPATANYGIQITEIAVLDTNKDLAKAEIPTCDDAAGVTVKSEALGTITVNITAGENQDGFTYSVYVDDATTPALSNVQAGVDYDITGIVSGEHTVKVVAMSNGAMSPGIVSEPVVVKTIMDTFTDAKVNMALNKAFTLDSGASAEGNGSLTNGTISKEDYVTPTKGQPGSWMTVDLGKAYDATVIDKVYVWFRLNFGGCYPENGGFEVQYSADGEEYTTVATVSQDELNAQRGTYTTDYFGVTPEQIDASGIEKVQYVRIFFPEQVAYGAQTSEICILDLDGDGVDPETTPVDPGTTPVDPGTTPVDPGTTPVDPGTTPVDPGTTPVDPGTTPVEMVFEEVQGANADITKGNFGIWINATNKMAFAVDPADASHIQGKILENQANFDKWAVQYKLQKTGLKAGEEYTISVDMKALGTDGVVFTDGDLESVKLADTSNATLTRKMTADENGTINLTIGAGQVGLGVVLDFSNIVVKDAQGNIVEDKPIDPETTPVDPGTTPAVVETTPVVEETTTPKVEETTEPKTTPKADETTGPKTTKKSLKRTKVTKASKKKASKKVKITFKRVKGAKKYKVQISKTRKFKKVLVKKTIKKYRKSITITNKRLKNKKKLYVRVRAVGAKKWSKPRRIRIKK